MWEPGDIHDEIGRNYVISQRFSFPERVKGDVYIYIYIYMPSSPERSSRYRKTPSKRTGCNANINSPTVDRTGAFTRAGGVKRNKLSSA